MTNIDRNKRIGFACGMFDLFHAGHVFMLQECKAQCDYLIVAVNSAQEIDYTINPGKKPPVFSFEHRKLILEHCDLVDEVCGYHSEEDLIRMLESIRPTVRFLGDDYRNAKITGPDLSQEIYYTNRGHGLSTSAYKQLIKDQT